MSDTLDAMLISMTFAYLLQLMFHSNKSTKAKTLNLITSIGIATVTLVMVLVDIIMDITVDAEKARSRL